MNQNHLPQTARRIVLTGVSRGLGRALTERFIAMGHTVLGCSRSAGARAELSDQFGPPHQFDVVDVSQDEEVAGWARRLLAQGPVDLVVNVAALINRNAPLWKVPAEEFSRVIDVNIKGTVNVIRHFVPAMVERKSGVVVNFSSYWGRSVSTDVAPYCATKWAIEGLTKAMAEELPFELAAVAVNPGIINTEMLRSCFGDAANSYPDPARWALQAAPFLLGLSRRNNGQSLTAPEEGLSPGAD